MYRILKRKRVIKTIKQVNDLINGIDKFGLKVIPLGIGGKWRTFEQYKASDEGKNYKGLSSHIIIELKDTKLEITSKYGSMELMKPCTYIFDLNCDPKSVLETGLETFSQLNRWFKVKKAKDYNFNKLEKWFNDETGKYVCSAKPTLGYNFKYQGMELHDCYEYDLNSAYFNTLLKRVPDLDNPIFNSKVKKGQVGFILDDQLTMILDKDTKSEVDVVFNLIETPEGLKRYCDKWYNIKKTTTDKDIKQRAKNFLNLPIGYSQRYNPFFRAYVVNQCNNLIDSLVEKNKEICLFWNTDAIFTTKPIDEQLDLGLEIGQFKKIEGKTVRYKGNNYQIDENIPVYRGIPKTWFEAFEKRMGRQFNILIDRPPIRCNKFEWDWNKLELKENNWDE